MTTRRPAYTLRRIGASQRANPQTPHAARGKNPPTIQLPVVSAEERTRSPLAPPPWRPAPCTRAGSECRAARRNDAPQRRLRRSKHPATESGGGQHPTVQFRSFLAPFLLVETVD